MGLVQYCARFIPNFAAISEPIWKLTGKDVTFTWGAEQQDALPYCLGAVLSQHQGGHWRVISYVSNMSLVERHYSQIKQDALGFVWACEHFNLYVY